EGPLEIAGTGVGHPQIVDALDEPWRHLASQLEVGEGLLGVAVKQCLRTQVIVIMGCSGEVIDWIEIFISLGPVRQEVVSLKLAFDVHSGDDMASADHQAGAVIPALIIRHLDVEWIQSLVSRHSDKKVYKREAVALVGAEGAGRVAGRSERIP